MFTLPIGGHIRLRCKSCLVVLHACEKEREDLRYWLFLADCFFFFSVAHLRYSYNASDILTLSIFLCDRPCRHHSGAIFPTCWPL
jgi:hypothetical protein